MFQTKVGTRLGKDNVRNRYIKPAAEEVGAPWCGWHTLRHTCASILFDEGRNVVQVQRWLGHHKPSFTIDTYVHLLDDDLGDRSATFDGISEWAFAAADRGGGLGVDFCFSSKAAVGPSPGSLLLPRERTELARPAAALEDRLPHVRDFPEARETS